MQATILNIYEGGSQKLADAEVKLTFRYFINYLQQRVADEETVKKEFLTYVLRKFTLAEKLSGFLSMEEAIMHKDELTLLYSLLMPVITEEKEALWALGIPLTPTVFFGTKAFYSLLTDGKTGELKCTIMQDEGESGPSWKKLQAVYAYVLNEFYDHTLPEKGEMIQTLNDDVSGLQKYFRVNVDTRFVKVTAQEELPEIDFKAVQLHGQVDWHLLMSVLPLSLFRFEGFTIITVTDITASQVVENIKNTIITRPDHGGEEYYLNVIQSLKILAGNQYAEFHMLPALRVNGRLVFNEEARNRSLMVKTNIGNGMQEHELELRTEQYLSDPRTLFFSELNDEQIALRPILKGMRDQGVVSYALLPVYYNNKIAGVLEAYSFKKDVINEQVLAKMETATPLLAQLLQKNIDEFDSGIETIIKEKFTSLQPAVQWKFNEVAWHYLRDFSRKPKKAMVESILFRDVYPLYGAVDIRNSTIERNEALKNDLRVQLQLLIDTLQKLKQELNIAIADELTYQCRKTMDIISGQNVDVDYILIREFLDTEVFSFLSHFRESDPAVAKLVAPYFDAINEETGSIFAHRRSLEQSMQSINDAINQYLELFKTEVQQAYPCYFEKFRTDGVEYDMYIGQSISPGTPFNLLYLKNIRLQQVTGMASIAKLTNALLPELTNPLQTTQLIFIHSGSIDISFRNDERRFDVEGAYNIRYQVVKKRIDKVTIKNTHERLTQPGKIAMVYFNQKDAEEYIGYIHYLQEQGILGPAIERLELEELQGVSGLKALRVDVVMNWI